MALQNVVNVLFLQEMQRFARMRGLRVKHRELRDTSNPFEMPEEYFRKMFRLSRECANYLLNLILPHLPDLERSTSIPNHIKVLTAVNFFANGSYQLPLGQSHIFGLSQPSVSRCIQIVVSIINNHLVRDWIKFPATAIEKNNKKIQFMEKYNFPGVIGAIDCTHIAIIQPPAEDENFPGRVYFNRKGYTSINTQIICDADLIILSINARYPGSTHDSGIWMLSDIRRHLETNFLDGDDSSYLLGDSGYPLQPWLLTPVDGAAEHTPESRYNNIHCSTRNCIERLNGVLKSRFRCLLRHRTLNYHPVKAAKIIYACAMLYNLARKFNVADLVEDENAENNDPGDQNNQNFNHGNNWLNEGRRIRNRVIMNFI